MSRPRLSIKALLIGIALIGMVPTFAFSGILLWRFAESERERAEADLVNSAKALARAIDAQFLAAEAALNALTQSTTLEQEDFRQLERRLRRTAATTGRHFALFRADGQQIINTLLEPGALLPSNGLELFGPVFATGKAYVTNVFVGRSSGLLLAGIGVPIMRDDKVKYVLSAGLFSADFATILTEPGVPRNWIISIVDRNGRHMLRSHRNEDFSGKPLVPMLVEMMKRRETGPVRTESLEGLALISTVQYAPVSEWAAAVGLPVAQLEAPMRDSLRSLMLVGAVLFVVAIFLAFIAARIVTRSVTQLADASKGLARADVVDPPPSAVAELDSMATALGSASRELHALKTALEAQVTERTRKLIESNRELSEEIKRRKESENQLLQFQKIEAIGQLTGGIAHDFNNMLAVILGSLRAIERRVKRGDADFARFIDAGIQGTQRAANLTARLLAFSRQQPLAPQNVDINKLILGMDEILRRTIPENIQIETVLAAGLWRAHIDPQGLESAIINLAVNARDAMPEGGKLTIETANVFLDDDYARYHAELKPGQYVMAAVTDTGTGMPPEVAARVFDPFFTTKPLGQGTGLGLSQVHGFIKQSGGHIAIYTEPGHGTTMKAYLPRASGTDEQDSERPHDESMPLARNNELILVVEDDSSVRKLTVEIAHELGYRTLEATNGESALALIDGNKEIALLFTDVVLPGMNGRQLATEAVKRRPELPVLFTTGYTRNAIVHHGVLDPDVQVVLKPYTIEALAQKISELLYGGKAS